MRNSITSKLMMIIAILAGVLLISATVGALAAVPEGQVVQPDAFAPLEGQPRTDVDVNNPNIPPLKAGGPTGPIVVAEPSQLELNAIDFQDSPNAPVISIWYGNTQTFGNNGDPQKWVNIVGNVNSALPIITLSYSINGSPARPLSRGADDRRLAQTGDFNIELDYTDLVVGDNALVITAVDSNAVSTQANVTVKYVDGGNSWPTQTYTYSWQGLTSISQKGQIVDGQWVLDNGTVRPTVFDYDRLLAIGDLSWKDYTVSVPITVEAIDESGYTGPSAGPGVGVMVRWQGHFNEGSNVQPRIGWRRLGALGWYRWQKQSGIPTSGFQFTGFGGANYGEDTRALEFGKTYIFKMNVQSNADPSKAATYRFKVWDSALQEPGTWDFESVGDKNEPKSGSLLLVAHHVDATFGTVTVALDSTVQPPKLTTNTSGTGSGTLAVVPNKSTFKMGEDVSLTATAGAGSSFTGWSGDISAGETSGNVATVEMFSNRTITAAFTDPNVTAPASDDFSACVLNTNLWTFYNPLADSSVAMTGSQVQLNVAPGASHDYWTGTTSAPRIMQFAEDKDFEIEAKFDSALNAKTQMQGILVEENTDNWLRFNIQHDGDSYRIVAATYVNSQLTTRGDLKNLSLTTPMYLRVNRAGNTWTLSYSLNGQTWTPVATFDQALNVTATGLYAGNVGKNNNAPATTVLVDYFFNTASPIVPEDGQSITLEVLKEGSGSVTVQPVKQAYACGEQVQLTATPDVGWKFSEWTGSATGTNSITTITMNKPESVTAVFVPDAQYTLTVTPNGNGTIAKDPDKTKYGVGEQVKLTAAATLGYQFTGWSGALTGTTNPVTITMDITKTIVGSFSLAPNRTLQTSVPGGGGTILVDPVQADYLNGFPVTLTAIPTTGFSFVGWGGSLAGETDSPFELVMDDDKIVTAQFALNVHNLTVTAEPVQGGTVTVDPVKPLYYTGEEVGLTAVPANGFIFLGWEGDLTSAATPTSVVMTKDTVIKAKFAPTGEFTLTTIANGPGTVAKNPNQPEYGFGDAVTLTATANPGFAFIGWSGSLTGTDNPAVITMTEDAEVTGTFTQDSLYTLDVTPIGNGQVTRDPIKPSYAQDEPVVLTAVPGLGHRFVGWTGDLIGTNNPATVIMTKNTVISATFEEAAPAALNVTVDPLETGTVTINPLKTEYLTGEIVTLTAKAAAGYIFSGWQGDLISNNTPVELLLDSDKNVVATFTNQAPVQSDDFNACTVDPQWQWVDPTGAADYELTGTQVRMIIPPGENYNLGTGGNFAARLMQPARNTDFSVEIKLDTGLDQQYQYQGILIEQDAANYLYFQFFSDGSIVKVYAGSVEDNTGSTRINKTVNVADEMYLRARRTGDTWKLDYSVDGSTWLKAGTNFKHEMQVTSVGPFAGSHSRTAGSQPGHTAVFDYFFNSDIPISPEDPAPPAVNVTVVGNGTVGLNPSQAAYACGDNVTLTATPGQGSTFAGWSGDLTGSNPVQALTVTGVQNVLATFVPQGGFPFKVFLPAVRR